MTKSDVSTIYQRKWRWSGILFILPAAITLCLFVIYPLIRGFIYAFTNYDGYSASFRFVGFQNFISIFSDKDFWLIMKNTFVLAIVYVVVLNILGVIFSVLLLRVGKKFSNTVKSILYLPCLIPMVVVGFVWKLMYDYNNGLINNAFSILKLTFAKQDWLGNPKLVILSTCITVIWYALGYYMVIYCAGLMGIPVEFYEVSDIEGASRWQEFKYVTVPLLAPAITINVVLSTIAILGCFDLPYTLTGGGGPGYFGTTLAIGIYSLFYSSLRAGKAFAMSAVLAVIAIVIAVIELRILIKREEY